jgi:hypothetical protein
MVSTKMLSIFKKGDKFIAYLCVGCNTKYLGSFNSIKEILKVYQQQKIN